MNILKRIPVPTGDILIVQGEKGKLECLSIGDYGKDVNLKADFMGLSREPSPVRHTKLLPLEEKWVITISTQYGCDSGCTFCDVPKVGNGANATFWDMVGQVRAALNLHPEVKEPKRINLHYARMGEPTWNQSVIDSAYFLSAFLKLANSQFHPVVSTMMPYSNRKLSEFINRWMEFKNVCQSGNAGLQLSINSTDEIARGKMFRNNQMSLEDIGFLLSGIYPIGRKITLNFAIGDWRIEPQTLLNHGLDQERFLCKLTPLHRTRAVDNKQMMPSGDWTEYTPYKDVEKRLRDAGYDVIVFLASKEEDESRITCGNAILANKLEISD